MAYYTRTYNPQPTTRVASTDLKNEFQAVENGLASAETADGKAIRAPEATTALPSAASRALKVLSFDGSGNPRTTIAETDLAAAVTAASNAATSESNAAASASTASTQAGNAATSASTATTQAGIATTQADAASLSATAASGSAVTASGHADTATTQAGIATTQAGIATAQADIATTKAVESAASAVLADASADAAALSEAAAAASAAAAALSETAAAASAIAADASADAAAASAASIADGPVVSVNGMTGAVTGIATTADLTAKQDALVSGTNIKTVGGISLLGSGDVSVSSASMLVVDEKASGVGGGAATIASWTTHALNTVKSNTISGAGLASNQITLPAGVYEIKGYCVGFILGAFSCRIRNITDSSTIQVGSSVYVTASATSESSICSEFTLASTKTIALQYYAATSAYGGNLGIAVSSGEAEIYASIHIEKKS